MILKVDGGVREETHCLTVEVDGVMFEIVESGRERSIVVRAVPHPHARGLVIRPTGAANHVELEVER